MNSLNPGIVELREVSVVFGKGSSRVRALDSVSLDVQPGEFVSLVGPSGCGKSSLLGILAGFTRPSSGSATSSGVPIVKPGPDRGVVFQQYSLLPWLTVRENVELGLKLSGAPRSERESTSRRLLGLCGLSGFEGHYPEQLSGGMKQRIGIVRALAANPRVLLMDEPFGALDAQTRVVMQQILTDMWQQFRISVFFITHDIEEAVFLSDRVYVMTARPGRIKAEISICLPRPRVAEMTDGAEFIGLVRQLKGLIRDESLAAMSSELCR
jgi:NitT/TauT family transport system ATP-binding protein